ncbi:MAG: phosphatidylserine decarboxylase [Planctomycetes bacterium]|nr:phosphatidylserine decarboxylase [Planctomycetota bacterium]
MSSFLCLALGVGAWTLHPAATLAPALVLLGILAFFRDPKRAVPDHPGVLVSPADGTVTEISALPRADLIEEPSLRIGIFLSMLDVHINRAPCEGIVKAVRHSPATPRTKETHSILFEHPGGAVVVRRIAGHIGRRIVAAVRENERLERGQRFGMIKFGSRTELYIPQRLLAEVTVRLGDKVIGGESILARTR